MKDITIVIPVFKVVSKRLRNFTFLFKNYLSKLEINIIVVEQVNSIKPTEVSKLVDSFSRPNVSYWPIVIRKRGFRKSLVLNEISKKITTKYMWMIDADVFLRYEAILNEVNDQDVICPYGRVLILSDQQTKMFIKNKKFMADKGDKFEVVSKFGPLSFIIKTQIYKENLMDEKFVGYGWEDLDFAHRISQNYEIDKIGLNGLHLYHGRPKINKKQEKKNRQIFFKTRKELDFKHLKNVKGQNITNIASLAIQKGECSNVRIVHVIAPALLSSKKELFNREVLAIDSIIDEKKHFENIVNVMVCDSDERSRYKDYFNIINVGRSSKDIGDDRGLPYLPDLFKKAAEFCGDDDIIFYTNSDCCLAPGTYNRLANTKTNAVEYLRRDVTNFNTLQDVFTSPNTLKETGVDGLAFRKKFFLENTLLFPDFFVGEPHWDTAICGALRTNGLSSYNTIDLYHPFHQQTWNTKNLTDAGKQNDKLYRDFLEYGVSKINVLSKPEEKIETSVVLVHYGNDKKRVLAAKRAMSHLPYQNILNTEFIFVDVVKKNTLFPEVDSLPNWMHVILKEKVANRDIFQKEAMMNIGAKKATGSVVIFMDADIWTDRTDWLDKISLKIREDAFKIVQGFSFCQDSNDSTIGFVSMALNVSKNIESSLHENPGLIIGMSKEILEKNNYFNEFEIMGGGDSVIMHEYLSPKYSQCKCWQSNFLRLRNILRILPVCGKIDYVDCNIVHENHGDTNFGYYSARHYATDYFAKDIKEFLRIGGNGLIEWVDLNCIERKIIKSRFKMNTRQIAIGICKGILKETI